VNKVIFSVFLSSVFLASCSSGPGTQAELAEILQLSEGYTVEQAECVAEKVFDKYGADEEALSRISSNSLEDLSSTDNVEKSKEPSVAEASVAEASVAEQEPEDNGKQVEGFKEFYDATTTDCLS